MSGPGRPSLKTPELCAEIVERLSNGEPLAMICRDEHMPARQKVYEWAEADPEFSGHIAHAREDGFDAIALEALSIADDGRRDYALTEDGREVVNHDHIQRSKLRVDTRLKLLAKWDPKRYGERSFVDMTTRRAASELTDDELAAHIGGSSAGVAEASDDSQIAD